MVLASKVHPIPLKFLSKEGQNSTLRAAILNCPWCQIDKETSGRVTWARFSEPTLPDRWSCWQFDVVDKRPGCSVRFKMAARSVEFWPSMERNFCGIGCTLETKTTVSNSTYCYLFIGDFKKYTVSGVTFSFNSYTCNVWFQKISIRLPQKVFGLHPPLRNFHSKGVFDDPLPPGISMLCEDGFCCIITPVFNI